MHMRSVRGSRAPALRLVVMCAMALRTQPAAACAIDSYGALIECGDFAPAGQFLALASGAQHHCAVAHPERTVACWPPSEPAATQAPQWVADIRALASGLAHTCAVWGARNTLTCWGTLPGIRDAADASTEAVDVTRGVRMLAESSSDAEHVCFLREANNDVSCFGSNAFQQLGLGEDGFASQVVAVSMLRAD